MYIISHNSRAYDTQFLLRRFLELKWVHELIIDGAKILSMRLENLNFVDSVNFLPKNLKCMPKSLDLTCKKAH